MSSPGSWQPPKPVTCPECCQLSGVVIVHGLPGPELQRLAGEGRIAFGGCVINVDDGVPDRRCRSCGTEWREAQAAVNHDNESE